MKKILLLLSLTMIIISCAEPSVTDYAIIAGTVRNNGSKEITVARIDRSHKKDIYLTGDGSFVDTLEVGGPVTYVFNRQFQICLENGYDLQIDYDAKNPTSTLKIIGKGSKINNYLRTSEKAGAEIQGEDFEAFYGLDKPDFRKKVGEIKNKRRKLLDSLTGISKELRTREEANIQYNYLIYLDQYPSVSADIRGLAANDLEYEDIARELKELDYLRVGDFQYSQAYVILTDQYFNDRIEDKIQIDGLDRESAFFNGMGEIPMGPIRNSLLYGSARMDLPNSADTKNYYERFMALTTNSLHKSEITETFGKLKKILPGEPSPKFFDYENFTGGNTSLQDLQGKYVYIDVWATWCKPCLAEIPALQKLEIEHESKIEFVSVSIDKRNDYDNWRQMVEDRHMGGTQLIADNAWESEFVQSYQIIGIPRFILIDPEGRIVDAKASRPSSGKLESLFKSLEL